MKWPFDQNENVASITTRGVLELGMPILTIIHYSDDHSWAFLCGTMDDDSDGRVISMREALEMDPAIREMSDLEPGWIAWRPAAGCKWEREQKNVY